MTVFTLRFALACQFIICYLYITQTLFLRTLIVEQEVFLFFVCDLYFNLMTVGGVCVVDPPHSSTYVVTPVTCTVLMYNGILVTNLQQYAIHSFISYPNNVSMIHGNAVK